MPREALCGWAGVLRLVNEGERQSTGRPHRAPPVAVAGDDSSQLNEPIGEVTLGNLKIEMDPRAVVSDLLVDVGVAF